jgi:hypothetical protein
LFGRAVSFELSRWRFAADTVISTYAFSMAAATPAEREHCGRRTRPTESREAVIFGSTTSLIAGAICLRQPRQWCDEILSGWIYWNARDKKMVFRDHRAAELVCTYPSHRKMIVCAKLLGWRANL